MGQTRGTRMLLAVLALAPLLAGCARAGIRWGPPPASADGRLHISYWEKWTGFEGDAMRDVCEAFNRSQDRITVEMLTVSQVDQKMLLATAGGNPPDVAGLWARNVNNYADKNALRPLDDYCRRAGIGPEDYIPVYWELGRYQGHQYALPSTPATAALHWNKKMFREAGLDPDRPPRTIQELDRFAARITRKGANGKIERMGFMHSEPGWWNWGWGHWFGGKLWDGHARITADSPENIRAFRWVRSYSEKYGASDLQLFRSGFGNFSSPQNAFIAGQVAMVLQGVWMYNFIDKYNPSLEWAAAPFPYPSDRPDLKDSSPVDMDVLVIPAGARHPNEAWEFIRFVNSQQGMELLCLGQRKHSPLRHVSEEFWDRHPNPYIRMFTRLAYGPNTFFTPRIGVQQEFQNEMNAAFDAIWLGQKTPEVALADVQRRIQPKLDRELRRKSRLAAVLANRVETADARR